MALEIIVTVVLLGYAIHTTYRGVRLLQNKELVLGIKREGKVYSNLSPRDKQRTGLYGGHFGRAV